MGLFGKRPDPKTQVREWSSKLRSEQNKIERQINQIKREEEKVAASLKQAAKKGDKESCRILAKEVVRARKSVTKMHSSKVGREDENLSLNPFYCLCSFIVSC